jgi:hypothetical protein
MDQHVPGGVGAAERIVGGVGIRVARGRVRHRRQLHAVGGSEVPGARVVPAGAHQVLAGARVGPHALEPCSASIGHMPPVRHRASSTLEQTSGVPGLGDAEVEMPEAG